VVLSKTALACVKSAFGGLFVLSVAAAAGAQTSNDAKVLQYSSILKQISDVSVMADYRAAQIEGQKSTISDLRAQIEGVSATTEAVGPMIDKMVVAIEREIVSDIPFKLDERYGRLDVLKETVADKAATPSEKMRKALNIYNIEVGYGQSMEAYKGDHPKTPGSRLEACQTDLMSSDCALTNDDKKRVESEKLKADDLKSDLLDGNFLRVGRVALLFQMADGSDTLRYDVEAKDWTSVSAGKAQDIRRAIRIAKGESAPGVVMAPVIVN